MKDETSLRLTKDGQITGMMLKKKIRDDQGTGQV